ncbi:hypothetical protein PR202_gb19360 [Eleusine coracana subsp. coracana]|uniref:Protein kinase domain-containing protein n=1 Tax=Eleusine coracana subsp. coracana TaxID=191504 RepID=A0AAV5F9T4_ELECO|nr:hypothetical protein PR202_gb19360 [Eleusine coracana subsp. coracana]
MGDGASDGRGGRRRVVGEYELLRRIGSGAYSQVWLGRHVVQDTEVAVKEIAMERLSSKLRESLLSEVDILRRISHPNIIALHDSMKNILLVENNENSLLKIADFGFANVDDQFLTEQADLWSVGVILYQLVTGYPPFNGDNQIQLLKNILSSREIRFPSDCELSHGCIDLCRKLLQLNSVERLTVEEFVNHPFLFEHAPERTVRRTPSDTRDVFPFINSSPTRPANQNSQEDCMPFPLDDESSGQDENPIPVSKSPMKSYGFAMGKRLDKTSGQSPSKPAGLFSRYIMGNNYASGGQRTDHPGKKTKESKIDEALCRKSGYQEDSPVVDSLEFVDQEYVFVSGPHPEGSSSSTSSSRQRNLPSKYDNSSASPPKITLLSAPMPINGLPINRQQSAGTGSLDSHCSPLSATSQGSADMSDAMDQPPSDYLTRIRLLEQYASIVAELVKEEIEGGRHLEAFSIQLVVLATWKQAIHVCSAYAASMTGESPSQDIPMKGFTADASHLLAMSQVADDACMQIERQFLAEVEYAEELAGTVGQIADATEMPDAIEIVFQSALQLGRRGGVDEMMGKAAVAISLYMRALEEIRQKRAAERTQQHVPPAAASHADLYGNQRAGAELHARVQELENGNAQFEKENQLLLSKIAEKEVEKDALVNRLNDLERNIVPSLKKALNDISLEKDAAVIAKEDALAQLRSVKKRLKEAEEEQYRAEEDSASLRAQLNTLQQQVMGNSYSGYTVRPSREETIAMETEIQELQDQLKQESLLRQQEQQKLAKESLLRQQEQHKIAEEQSRIASLEAEKQQLEDQIAVLTKKATEDASEFAHKAFSLIDSQSSEIEKLFDENAALSTSYEEAMAVTKQWENQVRECLRQNEELRAHLEKLRLEQASLLKSSSISIQPDEQNENISNAPELVNENLSLKDQLIKEQVRSEGLSAEIMKLSAELRKAVQAQSNLTRLYRPVLKDIESNLMKMKQETYATIQ